MTNGDVLIMPITDLRRKFGEVAAVLPEVNSLLITKKGRPFAILKATKEVKMKILRKAAGSWKKTALDNNQVWQAVLKRKSRKLAVAL